MTDIDRLIEKHHANGLLIDTNLLVLYVVGKTNKTRITSFKRTETYTLEDFELLEKLAAHFSRLLTTPHVLTEVSDLATLHGQELAALRARMNDLVRAMKEFYDESRLVAADTSFARLGLADAAVVLASRHGFLVRTDDVKLCLTLQARGVDAVNFNHVRTYYWKP